MTTPTDPTAVVPTSTDAAAPSAPVAAPPAAPAGAVAAPVAAPTPTPAPVPAAPPKRVLNPHALSAQPTPPPPHPAEAELAVARASLAAHAAARLAALPTDQHRAAITKISADPMAQLNAMDALAATPFVAPPPMAAPLTTAPTTGPSGAIVSDPDLDAFRAHEAAEKAGNPRYAARLFSHNADAIERGRVKAAGSRSN